MPSSLGPTWRAFFRAANGLGSRGAETLWTASSFLVGRMSPFPKRSWTSSGHERVLLVAPHPDDEVVGCAGTLIRHAGLGDTVTVAIVTDGSKSRALGIDGPTMAALRERESSAAAERMGVQRRWMGLPEGEWSDQEGRAAIRRALAEATPTVVYAPSNIDFHPEHRRVAALVAETLVELGQTPDMRLYAAQVPLTPLLTNVVHDVSDLEAAIRSVFNCYASQQKTLSCAFRSRRYAASFYGASKQAEAFCTIPANLYARLHRRPSAEYRPMGIRAWTDPLALFAGVRERIYWRWTAGGRRF
jgi:LmbE family N-acetylglucosaminyl deacetylase